MDMRTAAVWTVVLLLLLPSAWGGGGQETRELKVEGLIYDLTHPEADRRKEAAILLGRDRVRQAVPALVEATEDSDDLVRLEAVRALVRINDTRALPAYIRLTEDVRRDVQQKAIEGIINMYVVDERGFIQGLRKVADFVNPFSDDYNPLVVEPYVPVSQKAIDALAHLLRSPDTSVRREAATALGILRARSAIPQIHETLRREQNAGVKVELVRAIYKIGDSEAAQPLVRLIHDSDRRVRDEAIFTVGRMRVEEAVEPMKDLYEAGVRDRRRILGVPIGGADELPRRLLESLAFIGHPSCREIFLEALADERETYRQLGAEGLARLGDEDLTSLAAARYLRERSNNVKVALAFALYRMGRREHLIDLVGSLDRSDQAYYYLLEFSPEETRALYPFVRDEKDSIKVKLVDVIGQRGDTSALTILNEVSQSRNTEVVSSANLAIRRIHGRFPAAAG